MAANNIIELLDVLSEKNFTYEIVDGEFMMILGNEVFEFKIDDEAAITDLIQELRTWQKKLRGLRPSTQERKTK